MTTGQPELFAAEATVADDDIRIGVLIALLTNEDWLNAAEIIHRRKMESGVAWTDKLVRDLASASGGEVSGGQRGYKLTRYLTAEEKSAVVNQFKSQSNKMKIRADEIELKWRESHPGETR